MHHSQEQAFRPVPQRVNFLVEQASCVPQRVNFLVEQAGKPVHKKLIENGATSQWGRAGL
ncbi:hypothetical protein QUB16_21745 [Microcoleus sp. D3_18a_C4]